MNLLINQSSCIVRLTEDQWGLPKIHWPNGLFDQCSHKHSWTSNRTMRNTPCSTFIGLTCLLHLWVLVTSLNKFTAHYEFKLTLINMEIVLCVALCSFKNESSHCGICWSSRLIDHGYQKSRFCCASRGQLLRSCMFTVRYMTCQMNAYSQEDWTLCSPEMLPYKAVGESE